MLKTINDLVQQRNKELDNFMNAIKFDIISNKILYDINALPEKLLECCASINIRQNLIEDIPKMMKDLIDISFKTKDSIEDLDELIQQADVIDDAKVWPNLWNGFPFINFWKVSLDIAGENTEYKGKLCETEKKFPRGRRVQRDIAHGIQNDFG